MVPLSRNRLEPSAFGGLRPLDGLVVTDSFEASGVWWPAPEYPKAPQHNFKQPFLFAESEKLKGLRKSVLSKQITIF